MNLHHLPTGPRPPEVVNAIIEIPRGGSNKFEYDERYGLFRLDRVLYSAVHYPAAWGFVPSTLAGDGDAVDILVMTTEATFTAALIEARPVGMLRMWDEAGEDEKVLAVAVVDPRIREYRELDHVGPPPAPGDRALLPHLQGPRRQARRNLRLARPRPGRGDDRARDRRVRVAALAALRAQERRRRCRPGYATRRNRRTSP